MNKEQMTQLNQQDTAQFETVGILMDENKRSATMVIQDHHEVLYADSFGEYELLPIAKALEIYPWVRERYYCKAVPADYDARVQQIVSTQMPLGYFLHVKAGCKVTLPCQAAMYMSQNQEKQAIHSIIVLDEGAEATMITGCLTKDTVTGGEHTAIEEIYIGKNAKLVNTMVHSWGPEVEVYPYGGIIVEEGGTYENNYISLRPARRLVSNPQTFLVGKKASARYLTVVLSTSASHVETNGNVYLQAEGTSAELLHRGVCTGGTMYQGGLLIGSAPCKAHVDCAGMYLDATKQGKIISVPGLQALHPDAQMSHEASIGKLAPQQVEYLMARGMEEKEAISLLIRGFLGTDSLGLGESLNTRIREIAEIAGHGE